MKRGSGRPSWSRGGWAAATSRSGKTGVVVIVRGTKKVLDRIGGVTAPEGDRSTTRLGDWYVNVLFWKPQVALLVNEATLLPVLVPFAPANTLLARFRRCCTPTSRRVR